MKTSDIVQSVLELSNIMFLTTGHPHCFCKVMLFLDMVLVCVTYWHNWDRNCFETMNTEQSSIMSLVYAQFNNNFTRLSKFWKQFWKSIKGNKSSQRKEARVVAAYPPYRYPPAPSYQDTTTHNSQHARCGHASALWENWRYNIFGNKRINKLALVV